MATIEHSFEQQFTEENLEVGDKALKSFLRKLFDLNTNRTVSTMFLKWDKGGFCVRKPSLIYTAARIGFLAKMLNHSNENIRFVARNSLELDMKERGVVRSITENNFLRYPVKEKGLLDINIKGGFWVIRLAPCKPLSSERWRKNSVGVPWINGSNVNRKCTSHPHCWYNHKSYRRKNNWKRNLGKSTHCRFQQTEIPTDAIMVIWHRWIYLLSLNIYLKFPLERQLCTIFVQSKAQRTARYVITLVHK